MLLLFACTSGEVTESSPPDSESTENEAPSIPTVTFGPDKPDTTDDITCVGASEDPEGGDITYSYTWTYYDDVLGTEQDLSSELTSVSQQLTCAVVATDEAGLASEPGSASISIYNAPPGLAEIAIEPAEPTTSDTLTCVIVTEASDPDDHPLTYVYFWIEEKDELDPGFVESTLDPDQTYPGQTLACQVNAFDSIDYGEPQLVQVTIAAD
ncbi:MAG TPA: hypothetical protein QGF58_07195 [Myxococcota bacterium]|nr:hypothetical protein [Myxococcota bacterium]